MISRGKSAVWSTDFPLCVSETFKGLWGCYFMDKVSVYTSVNVGMPVDLSGTTYQYTEVQSHLTAD